MQSVAQQWLVYRLTHSPVLLGWVGFAGQIPVFFLATFGGVLADRWNRRLIIVGTQTASMILAFLLAGLTLTGTIRIWQLFVLATLLGVVNSIDIPTRQTFVADMVPRKDLPNAIALNSSMLNGARIVGPAVAGLMVASFGEGWCFFANGISYIAVIAGLLMMNVQYVPMKRTVSAFAHVAEGFRYVAATAPVRVLLVLLGVVSLVAMPYTVLMPIFADEILHGGASRSRDSYGLFGTWRFGWSIDPCPPAAITGLGEMGSHGHLRFWRFAHSVCAISEFYLIDPAFVPDGILSDDANGRIQYIDSVDGSGPVARAGDGGLLHDVHGNGSAGSVARRSTCACVECFSGCYAERFRGNPRRDPVCGAPALYSASSETANSGSASYRAALKLIQVAGHYIQAK